MDVLHGVQKTEGVGLGTNFGNDVKGAKELPGEFTRWTSGAEEFSLDESLVANLEVRWRSSAGVRRTLIATLGLEDVLTEVFVEFVEVEGIPQHAATLMLPLNRTAKSSKGSMCNTEGYSKAHYCFP